MAILDFFMRHTPVKGLLASSILLYGVWRTALKPRIVTKLLLVCFARGPPWVSKVRLLAHMLPVSRHMFRRAPAEIEQQYPRFLPFMSVSPTMTAGAGIRLGFIGAENPQDSKAESSNCSLETEDRARYEGQIIGSPLPAGNLSLVSEGVSS